jgi:hypothetical protein
VIRSPRDHLASPHDRGEGRPVLPGNRGRITTSAYRITLLSMKTLRLDPELEKRLQRAAEIAGESLSEFIRQAAANRADTLLNTGVREDFADVVGVIHGGGNRARRTGEAFTDLLAGTERRS